MQRTASPAPRPRPCVAVAGQGRCARWPTCPRSGSAHTRLPQGPAPAARQHSTGTAQINQKAPRAGNMRHPLLCAARVYALCVVVGREKRGGQMRHTTLLMRRRGWDYAHARVHVHKHVKGWGLVGDMATGGCPHTTALEALRSSKAFCSASSFACAAFSACPRFIHHAQHTSTRHVNHA